MICLKAYKNPQMDPLWLIVCQHVILTFLRYIYVEHVFVYILNVNVICLVQTIAKAKRAWWQFSQSCIFNQQILAMKQEKTPSVSHTYNRGYRFINALPLGEEKRLNILAHN